MVKAKVHSCVELGGVLGPPSACGPFFGLADLYSWFDEGVARSTAGPPRKVLDFDDNPEIRDMRVGEIDRDGAIGESQLHFGSDQGEKPVPHFVPGGIGVPVHCRVIRTKSQVVLMVVILRSR